MIKSPQMSWAASWREVWTGKADSGTLLYIWNFLTEVKVVLRVAVLQEGSFLLDLWLRVTLLINLLMVLVAHGGERGQSRLPAPKELTVHLGKQPGREEVRASV